MGDLNIILIEKLWPGYNAFTVALEQLSSLKQHEIERIGLPSTIRTCDLRLRRALLYPAELWADGLLGF
ncbi:MAG: hypothetical protein RL457_1421 [Pseudomonadota bacterium]|jgi:hypothetical protein